MDAPDVPGSAPQPHLEAGARREQLLLQAQNQLLQEFANNTWNSGKFHPGGGQLKRDKAQRWCPSPAPEENSQGSL